MYCKKCGAELPEGARFCTSCGQDQQELAAAKAACTGQRPDNYLVLSIIVTVLCCLPFGVAGLLYSTKVDSNWDAGNADAARMYSRKARTWALWGIGAAAIAIVLYVLCVIILVAAGVASDGMDFLV